MIAKRLVAAVLLLIALSGLARADVTVTDILGREVSLRQPARHIVLGEARHLTVLGLIHDDPVALISGWRLARGLDAPTLDTWRRKFPAIDQIRPVGAAWTWKNTRGRARSAVSRPRMRFSRVS